VKIKQEPGTTQQQQQQPVQKERGKEKEKAGGGRAAHGKAAKQLQQSAEVSAWFWSLPCVAEQLCTG
jgi:hypothetical protein